MYKDERVLTGADSMFQKGYLQNRTKKLEDNNTSDNNTYTAQTKTILAPSKKQDQKQPKSMTKKYSKKAFTKIMLPPPKLKTL